MSLALEPGSLIRLENTTHRFNHWTTGGDLVLRDPQSGNTVQIKEENFLRLYVEGHVELNVPPPENTQPWQAEILRSDFDALPKPLQDEAFRRKAYVDRVLADDPPGARVKTWPPLLATVSQEIGDANAPSWQTVSRWLAPYVRSDRDIRSLVPGHASKGRSPVLASPDERTILNEKTELWLDQAKPSKQWFVDQIDTEYRQAVGVIPGAHGWKKPSRATLYRMLDRIDPYEVTRRRHGKRAAEEKFKMLDRKRRARRRLEIVEIDHTQINLYVADLKTRLLLGRPWITVAIDVYTRMIVGLYVGFEPPSVHSVMQCLRNMILPKLYMRKEFPELELEWNAYGAPCAVVVDNAAEFLTDSFKHVAAVVGFEVWMAPVKHPEFKGTVERFNRSLCDGTLGSLPGKPIKPSDKSDDNDPKVTACVELEQFRRLLHYWLLAEYCNTTHTGIMDVPQRRWNEEVKANPVALPPCVTQLDALLGVMKIGTLTREGVKFMHLRYKSERLGPILRANGGSVEVAFKYNPGDLGQIHVIHPETREPIPVPVEETDADYASGLTLYQHKAILKFMRERNAPWENRPTRLKAVDALRIETARLLAKGRVRTRGSKTRLLGQGVNQPRTDIGALFRETEADQEVLEGVRDQSAPEAVGPSNGTGYGGGHVPARLNRDDGFGDIGAAFAAARGSAGPSAATGEPSTAGTPSEPPTGPVPTRPTPVRNDGADVDDDDLESLPVVNLSRGKTDRPDR